MTRDNEAAEDAITRLNPLPPSGLRVVEQVYLALRDSLADGVLSPGTRLLELQIAAQLGVSRTPVREALQRLEAEGLAVRVRGRGLVFTNISVTDVVELGRIRIELDSLAGGMLAAKAAGIDWDAMHRGLESLEEATSAKMDRASRVRSAHRAFHLEIYQLAFEPLVSEFLANNVLRFLEISTRLHTSAASIDPSTVKDHTELLLALQSGDPDKAATAAREHAQAGVEQVRRRIANP